MNMLFFISQVVVEQGGVLVVHDAMLATENRFP